MKRRTYLVTAAGAVALAGCAGSDTDSDDENEDDPNDDTPEDHGGDGPDDETGTFDDFEDLEYWFTKQGTMSADEDRSAVGSQSVKLEASMSDRGVMISRTFDSPQDFSEMVPGMAVASEVELNPIIQLSDDSGDRIEYRGRVDPDLPLIRYNFGVSKIVGDPTLSEITSIQITTWTGTEKERTFWCDDLYFVPRLETGTVLVQFDYGYETTYTEGYSVLEEYDVPATAFVNTDYVGNDDRMDLGQLEELHDDGWTIASQSATTADLTESDDPAAQIQSGVEWLEENGFEDGADYFAYPLGRFDEAAVDAVESHHDLGFANGYGVGGEITNTQLCPRVGNPDVDDAEQLLERTAEMNGLTTIYYTELDDDRLDSFEETMATLSEMESDGDLEVVLPSDVEEKYVF
ncbi:polysaccharide deacetylase family protein [Halostagnicola kamekurae]|uniref:Polysaccharide deacetylase n=1 Tax=Halostagnicola kamekurae TaxID=619731 RepID=A0A1I6PFR8_9EURY|nr:polysaccharide deacetylase family protein [Halostagnicola kamekurae]SFS39009.1 Polysaccharide deacetylase [Halostagnicola kamekurae]